MKPALHLPLLSRVLSQRWAIRRETLVTLTQAILAGDVPSLTQRRQTTDLAPREQADTSFRAWHYGDEGYKLAPVKTQAGYTVYNVEGWFADERGNLPPAPENVSVHLLWGALGRGWTQMDRWWMDPVEADEIIAHIAATTPEGGTAVLWFRSPGGIVTGIPETAGELKRLSKTRRLIAFTDDMCCSAAYWLGSQCEKIVATPTADVGGIGVYLAFYDFVGYLEQMGVKLEMFKAGDLKGIGVIGHPLDDPARELLQAGVLDSYRMFTKAVTDMRAIGEEFLQGQAVSGKVAASANLVDGFAPSASAFFTALAQGKV